MSAKPEVSETENGEISNLSSMAEQGQSATDKHGESLIQFDPAVEAKLRRKIDWMIVPTVAVLYLFCFIDRTNIGNARLAGFEEDLSLVGLDYNIVLSVFYVSYILFEIPANILCKWMGPGWFLPLTTTGFGVMSILTGLVTNRAEVCGVRFVLGIFEAGMLPGIAYYLSRWYRRAELVFRLALYIVTAPLAGAFGGLLASAILTLDGFGRFHSWQMIFAIEGIMTVIIGLIAFFTLTDRPETARWLSQEEKDLAIARVKSERLGTTQVLDKMDMSKLLSGITSPVTLSTSFVFLLDNIIVQGLAFFLPTIIRTIYPHYSIISQQLLTVPTWIVGAICTIIIPLYSYRLDKRQVFFIGGAPLVMAGFVIFLATTNPQARYSATFLIATTVFIYGALTSAQVSANVVSDTARSSAIGFNVMLGNMGGLVATWTYVKWDAPYYAIANGVNLSSAGLMLVVSVLTYFWMIRDNKKREDRNVEEELAGLSAQQIQDLDWRHPAFRWSL